MEPDRTSEGSTEHDAPGRLITVNQVVAWNLAWLRREAGLTQEGLGDLLGWPQNKVSEAERSWNGRRTREFSAQDLAAMAMALGVPIAAFFLPPLDDSAVWVIRPPGQYEDCGMGDLLAYAMTDIDEETPVIAAYRQRLLAAVGNYLGDGWRAEVGRWLKRIVGGERMREGAFRLEGLRAMLADCSREVSAWVQAIKEDAGEEDEDG
jgi:transcriptional regulator with XRE-family HTH domain